MRFFPPVALLWMLAPALVLMAVFFVWPLGQAAWMSTLDYRLSLSQPTFVGWHNYAALLQNSEFLTAVVNTLAMGALMLPPMVVVPLLMALLLNGTSWPFQLARTVVYIPVITSMVVVGLAWKWLYAREGLINQWLHSALGWPPIDWLVSTQWALGAVAVVVVWKGLAYYMMMYLSQLQGIPTEVYEAARLDGASVWRQHWHITVPYLRPMGAFVLLISTIGTLKLFTEIYVLTNGGPLNATLTWVYFVYRRAFEYLDLGTACAAGLLLMVALAGLSWCQWQWSRADDEVAA
ncbi:MAG: sugar ABC transporter permease [Vampirovibrionales bacterium]